MWSPRYRFVRVSPAVRRTNLARAASSVRNPSGPSSCTRYRIRARRTVLPVAELAEQLRDGSRQLHGLLDRDEDIDVRRHALTVGETTADQNVEPELPVLCRARAKGRCR